VFLELLLVLSVRLHLSLVFLTVLLDQFLFGFLLGSHRLHFYSHDSLIDESRSLHKNIEVVTSESVDLVIQVCITECFNQLNDDARWLQAE